MLFIFIVNINKVPFIYLIVHYPYPCGLYAREGTGLKSSSDLKMYLLRLVKLDRGKYMRLRQSAGLYTGQTLALQSECHTSHLIAILTIQNECWFDGAATFISGLLILF